jgi:apolipoprotein N-acyltransferase
MVNITNDSWYGRSSGPFQHLQISRIRAVENGLPLIRSGNNGISAIIDPVGRVTNSLGLDIVDTLDGYIPYKLTLPTIFSDRGSLGLIIGVFSVLIMHFVCFFLPFLWKYK